ncbi:MAG TPA: sigma-70 family RNA polymerase sigma factor [Polyangiaceae bacterium]|nr:sigma-70 family RNA polymerase sigma factor [Polyangiaceae bacterium]
MAAALTHDEATALYRRYGFFLRRRCALLVRDAGLVDDAMQEAFMRFIRSGAELREMEQPLWWLYRVVDRCCFDQLRRGKRLRHADPIEQHTDAAFAHPGVAIEIRDAVLSLLTELDDRERNIAVLAFVDGMTQGEIAAELGTSRVTVNKKIQGIRERALRMLGGRA